MKKAFALSAGLALIAVAPALADFPGPGTGGNIPDNNANGISSTIVLAGNGNISDLNVNIGGLRHSWIGDLRMTLTHVETATSVVFVNRPGVGVGSGGSDPGTSTVGDSSNYGITLTTGQNYTFDDEGADLLAAIAPGPDSNFFLPGGNWSHVNAADLSGFDGQPVAGTWILKISDHAGADTGSFANWGLKVTTVPAPGALALLGLAGLAGTRRRRG
jgi:MYXO-CTERM domain-containing protein